MGYFSKRGTHRATHAAFLMVHYPLYILHKMGLLPQGGYRRPWAANLAWYVRGKTETEAQELWDWVANDFLVPYYRSDMQQVIIEHQERGDLVVLVSAGPTPQLKAIAKHLGVEHVVGTDFEIKGGRYTGRATSVCIDEHKELYTKAYLESNMLAVDLSESTAYADSRTDLHLLEMVGIPVAAHPEPELRAIAETRGWQILPE